MELLVSIIIPIYNIGEYLEECINSILIQGYKNFELILVDDGSTDISGKICDDFASIDDRIIVLHKKNGGLSDARNTGLDIAKGFYVIFIDGDDFWENDMVIYNLLDIFENNKYGELDFINFNCSYYYQRSNKKKKWREYSEKAVNSSLKKEQINSIILNGQFPMSACLKIIRRDFLVKNNIRFIKDLTSEDIPWFIDMLILSSRFAFTNEYCYLYRKQVTGSLSSSFSEVKFDNLFKIISVETKKILNNDSNSDIKAAMLSFMAYELCILMGMLNFFPYKKKGKKAKKLKAYLWLFKYTMHPKVKIVSFILKILRFSLTSLLLHCKLRFAME